MAEPKAAFFSDIALGFNAHPVTGNLQRKTDDEAIKQSVKSLVLTDFFERPFKPNIGCSIRYLLFELFTPATKQMMENAIGEVIRNYEPRVLLQTVNVKEDQDRNRLQATIIFRIKNRPNEPINLSIILERVR
jgi:hypothetical protein